jgi:hypothetical protein
MMRTPDPQVLSHPPKADLRLRFGALAVDHLLCLGVSFIPPLGGLLAAAYLLFRDGFEWPWIHHRSLGKRLFSLSILTTTPPGSGDGLRLSLKRNWPLAFPAVLSMLPGIGWLVAYPVAVVVWAVEGARMLLDPEGRRWGDVWAGTQVVADRDVPAPPPPPPSPATRTAPLPLAGRRRSLRGRQGLIPRRPR